MTNEAGEPVVRCFLEGAPDVLISRAGFYLQSGGSPLPITDANRPLALQENARMASAGER